jgi:transcriptional regulator with XRE-family HTH domain
MTFGDRLRAARKQKGYTQEQLAELIGTAKSTYSNYEQGLREPDVFKIKALVKELNVTAEWLLGIDEETNELSEREHILIKKYRVLDERGKEAVESTVNHEYGVAISRDITATTENIAKAQQQAAIENRLLQKSKK